MPEGSDERADMPASQNAAVKKKEMAASVTMVDIGISNLPTMAEAQARTSAACIKLRRCSSATPQMFE